MKNIEIYKLVTCCKWSDVIGQTHPTWWQIPMLITKLWQWIYTLTLNNYILLLLLAILLNLIIKSIGTTIFVAILWQCFKQFTKQYSIVYNMWIYTKYKIFVCTKQFSYSTWTWVYLNSFWNFLWNVLERWWVPPLTSINHSLLDDHSECTLRNKINK